MEFSIIEREGDVILQVEPSNVWRINKRFKNRKLRFEQYAWSIRWRNLEIKTPKEELVIVQKSLNLNLAIVK